MLRNILFPASFPRLLDVATALTDLRSLLIDVSIS